MAVATVVEGVDRQARKASASASSSTTSKDGLRAAVLLRAAGVASGPSCLMAASAWPLLANGKIGSISTPSTSASESVVAAGPSRPTKATKDGPKAVQGRLERKMSGGRFCRSKSEGGKGVHGESDGDRNQ